MKRFFEEGDKVKVTLRFRGREMAHPELGMKLLNRVKDDTAKLAKVEIGAPHGRPPDDHGPGAALTLRYIIELTIYSAREPVSRASCVRVAVVIFGRPLP